MTNSLALWIVGTVIAASQVTAPAGDPQRAPGEFRLGAIYFRPFLAIDRLGYDTNVFNTPEPEGDFTFRGGPGLGVRVPFGPGFEVSSTGQLWYLYYHENSQLRRWSGNAVGGGSWEGPRTRVEASVGYLKRFGRPEFELDDRIDEENWTFAASLRQDLFARASIVARYSRAELRFMEGSTSEGANPAANRNEIRQRAELELSQGVTLKTSLLVGGGVQRDRFEIDAERDTDSLRLWAGFRVDSKTRLFGDLRGGIRVLRLVSTGGNETLPYALANLGYHFGPKTVMTTTYRNDREFTFFTVVEGPPTSKQEALDARVDRRLWGRFDLRLSGQLRRLTTDGLVAINSKDGSPTIIQRREDSSQGAVNLGVRLKIPLRLGFEARYVDRRSNVDGFDLNYWIYGATVDYVP